MEALVFIGGSGAAGGVIGNIIARRGMGRLFLLLFVFLIGLTFWAILKGRSLQGWDGLAYAILGIVFTGPGAIGLVLGGGIGLYRRRNSQKADDI